MRLNVIFIFFGETEIKIEKSRKTYDRQKWYLQRKKDRVNKGEKKQYRGKERERDRNRQRVGETERESQETYFPLYM